MLQNAAIIVNSLFNPKEENAKFMTRPLLQENVRKRDQIASKLGDVARQLREELAGFQEKLFIEYLY
jgi:hypothetical protein